MKEFIDKLISRLEEEKEAYSDTTYYAYGVGSAIKIITKFAEGYINTSTISKMENVGWIPCERELPEEDKYVLCQGNHSMFIACVDSFDGEWRDNHYYKRTTVKAWMPLPAPYQQKEGE